MRMVVYAQGGCSADDTVKVQLLASPKLVFNPIPIFCDSIQDRYQLTEGYDTSQFTGVGKYSGYGVNNGFFDPVAAGAGTFAIYYKYTLSNGCSDSINRLVTVSPLPIVDAGPDKSILQGGSVMLEGSATRGENFSYKWTPPGNINNDTILTPLVSPPKDTRYTLKVTNGDGCYDYDNVLVKVYKLPGIPNAFSPNNDGINDTWHIQNINSYNNCLVEVYNRYGKLVFHSVGYNTPWDGTYNGSPLPVGTYYYIINLRRDKKVFSGYVLIIR